LSRGPRSDGYARSQRCGTTSSKNESGSYYQRKESQRGAPPNQAKGTTLMVRTMIESMCPFFIVRHVDGTIAFYADKLGFETSYKEP
jgi:hypothetical protein